MSNEYTNTVSLEDKDSYEHVNVKDNVVVYGPGGQDETTEVFYAPPQHAQGAGLPKPTYPENVAIHGTREWVDADMGGTEKNEEYVGNKAKLICMTFTVTVMCIAIIVGISIGLGRQVPPPDTSYIPGVDVNCITLDQDVNIENCRELDCVWNSDKAKHAPWCTYRHDDSHYHTQTVSDIPDGWYAELVQEGNSKFGEKYGKNIENVAVHVKYETDYRLRVKIYDKNNARYEVPQEAVDVHTPPHSYNEATRLYDVNVTLEPRFSIQVIRRQNETVIFDTSPPGFTFADQFVQLTASLASGDMYGLGEHNHGRYKHDMGYKNWTIFTRDVAPVDQWNLYGAQPFYMNLEETGEANAVLLLNSNAMDILLQPDPYPAITYRVIGGILDFYIFLGPTPENIVQQYTEAFGRPIMPPYWALGFQLSRWNYDNLTHVRDVVQRNREAGIPQDVQYGDIDYMVNQMDFTRDPIKYDGLGSFVQELHDQGQRYIIILDHCIGSNTTIIDELLAGSYPPYTQGLAKDIFVKDGRNPSDNLKGEVWPGESVYPDFTQGDDVRVWWKDQCQTFYNTGVEYDALWIDMNEPSNFVQGSTTGCAHNTWNYPPYVPNVLGAGDTGMLFDKTICMDAIQAWGRHYDVHSLYGHSMAQVTYSTLREMFPTKRPLVLTRSNYVGTQKYAMHWLGDNQSQWRQMPWSIVGMLEYSLFGFSYTGADICGFWYDTTEEMCIRWTQLGAFYPFARNHNAIGWRDQDPAAFGEPMIRISRSILMTRYKLLPYLYTLMHQAHTTGSTVARPLMHEFTSDRETWNVDRQFLWGPALLITPVMEEGVTQVEGYFPAARWFNYYTGKEMENTGSFHLLFTPLDTINLHVRGGHIIPWQEPANTTVYSRQNDMGLIVALGDSPTYTAVGSLFWDDGESHDTFAAGNYLKISFECSNFVLRSTVEHMGYTLPEALIIARVVIWGLPRIPVWVNVDEVEHTDWTFSQSYKSVELLNLKMSLTQNHTLTWQLEV